MPDTKFGCLPTIIGSMPHKDAKEACALITRFLKDIPAWPQLPNRSFLEGMNVQFSEGLPGFVVKEGKFYVDRARDLNKPLEQLYTAYLENKVEQYPVSADHAAGLQAFLALSELSVKAVKGQVTGPVTWGLSVADDSGRAIIWDDTLSDAAAKLLRLKASWQEKKLREISRRTIIFVDEPYMQSYGSSSLVALSREKVISLIDEVMGGITGLKGIHCCGNTDWSILLKTGLDILSFDAYNYAQSLSLYPAQIKSFLARGGAIAWGIVPDQVENIEKETVASLKDRLEDAIAPFTRDGIPFRDLIEHGLLTPSCGLANLSIEASARALELLVDLSAAIRKRYL